MTAGIATWVALWWVFEPISIPRYLDDSICGVSAAGVLSNKEVAQAYGHWLILLLLGGFTFCGDGEKRRSSKDCLGDHAHGGYRWAHTYHFGHDACDLDF